MQVDDDTVGSSPDDSADLFIDVLDVNDAPVVANIETTDIAYTENQGAVVVTNTITLSDQDDANLESVTIQITGGFVAGEDVLTYTTPAGTTSSTDGTLNLSETLTLAEYQAVIRSVTYTNTSENPDPTTRTISFTVNDGDADSNTQTRDITVDSVNDDPTNAGTLPTDITVTEDVASDVDLSALDLSDVDAGSDSLTVTLSTGTGGELTATSGGGVTVGGSPVARTFTGTPTDLNAYFDVATNIRYVHGTANTNGDNADTITVVVNDNGNTGTGGGDDQTLGAVNVNITAVNDAPTLVQPDLICNGTFDSNIIGFTTTGAVRRFSGGDGSLEFGAADAVGPHTAAQTIATLSGTTYTLTFDYRDNSSTLNQSLQVSVDGASNLLTTPQIVTDVNDTTFVRHTFSFTADSDTATVTFTDTSDTAGVSDGTAGVNGLVDNVSVRFASGTMNVETFVARSDAIVLNPTGSVFDAELSQIGDFAGATLTLVRNGGANPDDELAFNDGNGITFSAGNLIKNGQVIASFDTTTTAGQLVIDFTSANGETPTEADVNAIVQQITYRDGSDTPPASVQIDWTVDDGNASDAQGPGPALASTGNTRITIQSAAFSLDRRSGQRFR